MAISFTAIVVRNERRVRLLFSAPLGAGAFGPGSTVAAQYTVVCTDGSGSNPALAAAIPVADSPSSVELALTIDLVAGGAYSVTSQNVPGADTSLSPPGAEVFVFGALSAPPANNETPQVDIGALLYGTDLVWTGSDFLELPTGDLASVSGVPNVQAAEQRRLTTEDVLPWDPTYGLQGGSYVEGPTGQGLGLVARIYRQAMADNRAASATVSWVQDPASPGDNYFPTFIQLVGASPGDGFTVNVQQPSTS